MCMCVQQVGLGRTGSAVVVGESLGVRSGHCCVYAHGGTPPCFGEW